MKLVVGIGNPGKRYERTRHNVGFDVVETLARADGIEVRRRRFDALVGEGRIRDVPVVLIEPQTYVNNSGSTVRQALDFWKLHQDDLLVVCDDANLELGRVRIRRGGSSGGHRGLESIETHLGTDAYPRLRIGISHRGDDLVDHVLGRFARAERQVVDDAIIDAARAVGVWLVDGIDVSMNEFNG